MQVSEYALFPTRLLAIEFPNAAGLNAELEGVFQTRPEFRDDFNMHPDALNLLALAGECPALGRLAGMFREGLQAFLRAEGARGEAQAEVVLFSNYAGAGD